MEAAASKGFVAVGVDLPEVDVCDPVHLAEAVRRTSPEVIVNCAAFTAVDAAEGRPEEAFRVNGDAVRTLAALANELDALLVQISTDYVFDGTLGRPYREGDPPCPLSVYGQSKLAGEEAAQRSRRHLVLRTAWLFGHGGRNFVEAIRSQIAGGATVLRVVSDQRGSPSYATDVAQALLRLVGIGAEGVVHVANRGSASWFEFAAAIARLAAPAVTMVPITTAESGRPARRPAFSVLDTSRLRALLGAPLPHWEDALRRYLAREGAR